MIAGRRSMVCLLFAMTILPRAAIGQPAEERAAGIRPVPEAQEPVELKPLPEPLQQLLNTGTALNPQKTVFLDNRKKRVLLRTQVACNDCLLEMLLCTEGTKHHESILWIRSQAFVIHTALLALGAEPGRPASFSPEFIPPSGPKIDAFVNWVDEAGMLRRVDARTWVRHSIYRYFSHPLPSAPPNVELPYLELRYDKFNNDLLWYGPMTAEQKQDLLKLWDDAEYTKAIEQFYRKGQSRPMTAEFVFTGSHEYEVDNAGNKRYAAEEGYVICVANFAAAMIDVKEASSAQEGGQSYEAWTDRIPPQDTPVVLELVLKAEDDAAAAGKSNATGKAHGSD